MLWGKVQLRHIIMLPQARTQNYLLRGLREFEQCRFSEHILVHCSLIRTGKKRWNSSTYGWRWRSTDVKKYWYSTSAFKNCFWAILFLRINRDPGVDLFNWTKKNFLNYLYFTGQGTPYCPITMRRSSETSSDKFLSNWFSEFEKGISRSKNNSYWVSFGKMHRVGGASPQ